MTRFTAPILMCPANYDIAMLALFPKLLHVMGRRDWGETEEERHGTLLYVCERHSSLSLSRGVVMN